ncbi:MAG: MYXO-CTERM domain-containing protein, partial [Myxococcota bacterium]
MFTSKIHLLVACAMSTSWAPLASSGAQGAPPVAAPPSNSALVTQLRAAHIATTQRDAPPEYAVRAAGPARWLGTQAGHGLDVAFDAAGVHVAPLGGDASVQLSLRARALGCEGALTPLGMATPAASGNRVELSRDGLVEWYLNGPLGVEQGFTVAEAPPCPGPKVLTLTASSPLEMALVRAPGEPDEVVWRRPGGDVALRYTGLFVRDAAHRVLPAWLSVADDELRIHVDDTDAVYPVEVDPLVSVGLEKLFPAQANPELFFGTAISISPSGTVAVVGATDRWDSPAGVTSGAVYVFTKSSGLWTQVARLVPSDGAVNGSFGYSVALSWDESTIVVGAPFATGSAGVRQGAAYVFRRPDGIWTQVGKFSSPFPAEHALYGVAVALSINGDKIVVGAPHRTLGDTGSGAIWRISWNSQLSRWFVGNTATLCYDGCGSLGSSLSLSLSGLRMLAGAPGGDRGRVFVFDDGSGGYQQSAKLFQDIGAANDGFGVSLVLSGDGSTAIVGAPYLNGDHGAAYIFALAGGSWTQQAKLVDPGAARLFGFSVALASNGNTALVGTLGFNAETGTASVFVRSGAVWTHEATLRRADPVAGESFGRAVGLAPNGSAVFVGATGVTIDGYEDAGAAFSFARVAGAWTQGQQLFPTEAPPTGWFGAKVVVSQGGNVALVSMPKSAAVYFFERISGRWETRYVYPDPSLTADEFGSALALSADGSTALVGACKTDYFGLVDFGSVYVFQRSGGLWEVQQQLFAGMPGDQYFGCAVALSGDGNTALIGGLHADLSGSQDQGAAWVFTRSGGVWNNIKTLRGDGIAGDFFGHSVALSADGSRAVIGAVGDRSSRGAVFVVYAAGGWSSVVKLSAADAAQSDWLGWSVAVSADGATVLAGAPGDAIGGASGMGSAYVFFDTGATWTTQQKLEPSGLGGAANDRYGWSVALSSDGSTAVVGAHRAAGAGGENQGATYLLTRAAGVWSQQKLSLADGAAGDEAGTSVALSGNGSMALIGSPKDDEGGPDLGSVTAVALRWGNGDVCLAGGTCASGHCVDGVCCDTSCGAGPCDACSVAAGGSVDGMCESFTGLTCDDGSLLTKFDVCGAGGCAGVPLCEGVACALEDACHPAAVCDPNTGGCVRTNKVDGTVCDDGDACTQADTCQGGTCAAGEPVICSASDPCHVAGSCDSGTGECSNPAGPNGTACDDANACTPTDACQSGVCMGQNPLACAALDDCHDAGVCAPETGQCSNPTKVNGTACDDGDLCTWGTLCRTGTCTGAIARNCVASDACHVVGACDSGTGACTNPLAADATACDDGDAQTDDDVCTAGACAGVPIPKCEGVVCAASDACHAIGTCDPATGVCSDPPAADGTTCDDGDAQTLDDACTAGACVGVAVSRCEGVVCAASDACHVAGTCDPATGVCSDPPAAEDTPCMDGTCQAGTCVLAEPIDPTGPSADSGGCSGGSNTPPLGLALGLMALLGAAWRRRRPASVGPVMLAVAGLLAVAACGDGTATDADTTPDSEPTTDVDTTPDSEDPTTDVATTSDSEDPTTTDTAPDSEEPTTTDTTGETDIVSPVCTPLTIGEWQIASGAIAVKGATDPNVGGVALDLFRVELYEVNGVPQAPGVFDLAAAPDDDYGTCDHCVRLYQDVVDASFPKVFQAVSGTLRLTAVTSPPTGANAGALEAVTLVEYVVDPSTGRLTPVVGGACLFVASAAWDTRITLPAACGITEPQACSPLDSAGCVVADGQACDVSRD